MAIYSKIKFKLKINNLFFIRFYFKVEEFSYGPTLDVEVEVETPGFIENDDGNEFFLGPQDNYTRRNMIITIDEETEKIDLKLSGRILEPGSFKPVAGAILSASLGGCCVENKLEIRTDRNGYFEVSKKLDRLLATTEEQLEKDEEDGAKFTASVRIDRGGYLSRSLKLDFKEGEEKNFERKDLVLFLSRHIQLTVKGNIKDAEGSPVAGAYTSINCGGVIKRSTRASGFGAYEFEFSSIDNELLPVNCQIWVTAEGYQSADHSFKLEKKQADNRELTLSEGESKEVIRKNLKFF